MKYCCGEYKRFNDDENMIGDMLETEAFRMCGGCGVEEPTRVVYYFEYCPFCGKNLKEEK